MLAEKKRKEPTHEGKRGDHPVGGAVGAAVGAAAGAAAVGAAQGASIGSVAGLPGAAAGVAIGGVVGALAGKAVAQEINPTTEDVYWSEQYPSRPYARKDRAYDVYRPAYLYGVEGYTKYDGRDFSDVEMELRSEWDTRDQNLPWDEAQPAARDAYERLRDQYRGRQDNIKDQI